jgi:hypothetical protein
VTTDLLACTVHQEHPAPTRRYEKKKERKKGRDGLVRRRSVRKRRRRER